MHWIQRLTPRIAGSYILMSLMITAGISLRKSGILPPLYLSVIYVTMGIPLFFSSFRFYYAFQFIHPIK
jgi:hypothetical protein